MRALVIFFLISFLTVFQTAAKGAPQIPRGAWQRAIGDVPTSCQSNCPNRGIALGGFGAGSFMYNISGSFGPWADEVGEYSKTWLEGAAFHLFEKKEEAVIVKCLCTQESVMPAAWNELGVGEGTYYAMQPKGWCVYNCFRSEISTEFFSPIIPYNYQQTSYPVAVWQFEISNPSADSVEMSVMFTWPNPPFDGGSQTRTGFNTQLSQSPGITGMVLKASHPSNTPETQNSEWCIATTETVNSIVSCASWDPSGDGGDIWSQFSDDGILTDSINSLDSAAALAVKAVLGPGEDAVIPMVLSWDFPVVEFKSNYGTGQSTQWWKKYCEHFDTLSDNSFEIAIEALGNYQSWGDQIDSWMLEFTSDPRYPDWLLCAAFNELYYNQFGGSFWESGLRSGHAEEFMGLHPEDHKNFIMECQAYPLAGEIDVSHYSSIVYAKFWPQMEKDLIRCHADVVTYYDQCDPTLPYQTSMEIGAPRDISADYCRIGDPFFVFDPHAYRSRPAPCADGHIHVQADNSSKFIQRCWRYYSMYEDMEFLEYVWPAVESTYVFMKQYDCESEPKDSLPDIRGYDNTYDGWGMWGTDMYSCGFWVGALEAMDTMAAILNKPVRVEVQAWLEAAKRNLDAQLWDSAGQYYRIDTESQYPTAVFSDALCAQRFCESFDLPDVWPRWKMNAHLQKVYDVNVAPNTDFGARLGRLPDGSTVPTGDRDTREYWVGTTYWVAAMMFRAGMTQQALTTAWGSYYPVYQAENLAYWFNTPEAWWDGGVHPRPSGYPHQYQRARAVWELMFEIQMDTSFYQPGDANGDGAVNGGDVVYLLNYLFRGGDPPDPLEAGDCNCNGVVSGEDIIYLLNYLYRNGPPPCG
jgi:non-lysosomal glucosylceramidase